MAYHLCVNIFTLIAIIYFRVALVKADVLVFINRSRWVWFSNLLPKLPSNWRRRRRHWLFAACRKNNRIDRKSVIAKAMPPTSSSAARWRLLLKLRLGTHCGDLPRWIWKDGHGSSAGMLKTKPKLQWWPKSMETKF